ncbi:MAG TPA: molybdopterin dinucleotide binding domain-containing protein [Fimbriimonadaceae bacterium]|nr:molybdopterin dinucleotide binding domain-containing protein [Fimbriimonadaceae bacterium]
MRSHDPDKMTTTPLESFPPEDQWDDWFEYDPGAWPKKVEKRYSLVPTICFNCEAACGLMAFVDKETGAIRKLEGNPYHPGSRGKNCAKGPATINQVNDPNRILYPLKRSGPRGSGKWERTTWNEVLDTFAAKIRKAIVEDRKTEVMYHVGRPGEDGYVNRVLQAWGVDAHNSHTNVCSSGARVGYALWAGADRPSPDHANAKFILLLSSHLETGHYFNPHAQRIIEGKFSGAKMCVVDVRHSNTASKADWWLAPWPGTEPMLLLAIAKIILDEGLYNREFLEKWVNWEDTLAHLQSAPPSPGKPHGRGGSFDDFIAALREHYAWATPEAAAQECGVDAGALREIAREIGKAGTALATHVWRNAAAGNLGGWQVSRCLEFLVVLMGAVGTEGGTNLNSDNKFVPPPFLKPPGQSVWSELLYPREYPLAFHEMSILLPHFLMEGRGKVAAYFTRVYNPVWTNPDGIMWERVLKDESKIELHGALTPVWNETAQYADYVLPMGNGAERHDLMSQETHAAKWIGFRQPVQKVARERKGEKFEFTYEANPGEVWEETEFWIELSWRIDPDGSLGIRKYFESPFRPGEKIKIQEYYRWIFENSVPGLPEAAAEKGLTPYEYMSRYGAFLVKPEAYGVYEESGFKTPSKKLELFSKTMADWGWTDQTMPGYIKSHVYRGEMKPGEFEFVLVPTFRLPTLIHTRSANAKWLYELSNSNPVWIHPTDAEKLGIATGDLVRIATRIGYYVNRAWVTEGMRPGIVACSHHLGRWRLNDEGTDRMAGVKVVREEVSSGVVKFRRAEDIEPYESKDPDTKRIWWTDGGVHQNLTFAVQPDPISGQHCWHQRVVVSKAAEGDAYGDIFVDTNKSMEAYRDWLSMTKPAPGPGGLRRPLWFDRALRPSDDAYVIKD